MSSGRSLKSFNIYTNRITMSNQSEVTMNKSFHVLNLISWLFGLAFFAIGVINTFWGNDPGFGVFIVLLSLVYFPPLTAIFKEKTGFSIPRIIKILLALFILWAALGVGELFDKIDLMMMDL
jgi:hypothetical protein